jgi:EmrB/QacA subfamily drug resistance transporter
MTTNQTDEGMTIEAVTSLSDRRRWTALAVIALIQFILVLDITVVNNALPHIQSSLHFSRAGLAWVVDGYVLTAGGLLLLGGRLADLLGRKRMFLIGVTLFAVASVLSGAATSSAMLVASRLASPAAFGLVALLFTGAKERAKAIGIMGGVAGLGGTLGPVLSGLFISVATWRWIFYVNVPVAVFSVIAVGRLVAESRAARPEGRRKADVTGAVLGTAGLSGVVFGFISAGNHAWGNPQVWVSLLAGALAAAAFVVRERTAAEPLVPAGFFANTTRVTSNVANMLFASVFFTLFFLLTLYWQQVQHWSAIKTGVAYLPFGVAISVGIGLASTLVPKVGLKSMMAVGAGLFAVGMLLVTGITVHGSYVTQVLPGMLVMALGSGINFATFGIASVWEVSEQDASLAAGIQSTAQQVGGAIGLAVLATIALRHATTAVAHHTSVALAQTDGAILAFKVGVGIAAVATLLALLAPLGTAGRHETPAAQVELEPAAA